MTQKQCWILQIRVKIARYKNVSPELQVSKDEAVRPNRNNRRRYNNNNTNGNNNNNNSSKFVPKLTTIESLVSSSKNKGQDFTKFQNSIHNHALTTFKNSKDISKAILEFVGPHVEFRQNKPNLTKIRTENNLHPKPPPIPTPPATEEEERAKFLKE